MVRILFQFGSLGLRFVSIWRLALLSEIAQAVCKDIDERCFRWAVRRGLLTCVVDPNEVRLLGTPRKEGNRQEERRVECFNIASPQAGTPAKRVRTAEPESPMPSYLKQIFSNMTDGFKSLGNKVDNGFNTVNEKITKVDADVCKLRQDHEAEVSALRQNDAALEDQCIRTEAAVNALRKDFQSKWEVFDKYEAALDHLEDDLSTGMADKIAEQISNTNVPDVLADRIANIEKQMSSRLANVEKAVAGAAAGSSEAAGAGSSFAAAPGEGFVSSSPAISEAQDWDKVSSLLQFGFDGNLDKSAADEALLKACRAQSVPTDLQNLFKFHACDFVARLQSTKLTIALPSQQLRNELLAFFRRKDKEGNKVQLYKGSYVSCPQPAFLKARNKLIATAAHTVRRHLGLSWAAISPGIDWDKGSVEYNGEVWANLNLGGTRIVYTKN